LKVAKHSSIAIFKLAGVNPLSPSSAAALNSLKVGTVSSSSAAKTHYDIKRIRKIVL